MTALASLTNIGGLNMATVEASVEVDLDDFDDDEIADEFYSRGLDESGGERGRDFDRLAELIAEGDSNGALDLLTEISGGAVNATTVRYLASLRQRRAA